MNAVPALALGFLLGLQHACDADHVAAVSAIVARQRRLLSAWPLGAAWGLGHGATVFAAGCAIILLRLAVPEGLSAFLERAVGLVLVLLGALNVAGRLRGGVTAHAHGGSPHLHLPDEPSLVGALRAAGPAALARAGLVGVVHGLAGTAGVALVAVAAVRPRSAALAYLVLFGLGTTLGMLALSSLLAYSMARVAASWRAGERALGLATGLLSLGLGLRLLASGGATHSVDP